MPAPPHIPDYLLLREIGRGSYGAVWLARSVTGHHRAVKIVWRASFEDPQPYEREFRGIKEFAAVSLTEPRQLALLHVGRNDEAGFFYCVMELADDAETGREIDPARYVPLTLREKRTRRGRFPAAETLALGVDLASALAGLHTHGLVHRDIKPSNIIYVGGVPKLADIGLVTTAANAELTISRVGNAGYMPPDFPGTASADVYGLAKVLYELVTGRAREDFPRLPIALGEFPDRKGLLELNEIFAKACDPNPEKRYRDATTLRDELLLLQAGKSVRRLRATERHLARALKVAAVLAVAAVIASGAAWLATRRANTEALARAAAEDRLREIDRRRVYSGNLASAQNAIKQGDLVRARRLLEDLMPAPGKKDLRGFEWRALWHQAKGDPCETIRTSGPEIDKLALSPDESLLAVHDKSDVVTIYDAVNRIERLQVPGIWKLAGFSADGHWLVGANAAQVSFRWSVHDGKPAPNTGVEIGLPIVALGTDAVVAVTREAPRKLRQWNFATHQEEASFDLQMEDGGPPWNEFIASANQDGTVLVRVWLRNRQGRAEYRLTCVRLGNHPSVQHRDVGAMRPGAVGVDAIGPWAFFDPLDDDPEGVVWRCRAEGWMETAERLPRAISKATESSVNNAPLRLLVRRREIGWRPASSGGSVRWARGHNATINELAISARQRRVYSAAADGSLLAWDAAGPAPPAFAGWNSNAGATGAVFTSDGTKIWVPEDGSNCVLLDVATLAPLARAAGMHYPLALTNGRLIGIGKSPGLQCVDPATGEIQSHFVSDRPLRIAAVSGNGQQLAAINDRDVLVSLAGNEVREVATGLQSFVTIAFDGAGQRLWMTTPFTRELVGRKWPEGDLFNRTILPARISTFLVAPDQQHLIFALSNGNLEIRGADKGELLREVYSGSAAPQTLALSPDHQRAFVGGGNGDIHCFNPSTWEEIHAFALGEGVEFHKIVCAPDGRTLAALTKKGALYLIRTD